MSQTTPQTTFLAKPLSRRTLLRLSAGVGAVGLLAACAPVAGPSGAAAPAAQEPIKLLHWHQLSASDGEVWTKMFENFNAAHTDVQIEVSFIEGGQLNTKVAGAIAAATPPDSAMTKTFPVIDWFAAGSAVALNDLMTSAGLDMADFDADAVGWATNQGNLLIVPMDVHPFGALINTDHAQEAGLDVANLPTDGDTLLEWADKMTVREGDQVVRSGFLLTGSGVHVNLVFGVLAQQWGAQRISADGTKVTFLDTDAPTKAAQWVLDAFDVHKVGSRDVADRYKAFGEGQGSIFWTGPWTLFGYRNTEGLHFMSSKVTQVGAQWTTQGEMEGVCAFKAGDDTRLQANAASLKWLSDNSLLWVTEGRGASPRASIRNTPEYTTTGTPWELRQPFVDSLSGMYIGSLPQLNGGLFTFYGGGENPIAKAMDPVWVGDRTIEQGLEELAKEWQDILDRSNA